MILHLQTSIAAPPERVFDLARSIDAHLESAAGILSVHGSAKDPLSVFWFIFDCATNKFTFDLKAVNRAILNEDQQNDFR